MSVLNVVTMTSRSLHVGTANSPSSSSEEGEDGDDDVSEESIEESHTLLSTEATASTITSSNGLEQQNHGGLFWYYFCHGIWQNLPGTAIYLVLKEEYHLSPAEYSFVLCFNWIPWILKPLFGFVSDRCPVRGYRRSPYIMAGILLNCLGWTILSSSPEMFVIVPRPSRKVYIATILTNSLASVLSETAVDSLLAERARGENSLGWLQSTIWTYDAAGSVVGAVIPIAAFAMKYHPRSIILLTGMVTSAAALALPSLVREEVPVEAGHLPPTIEGLTQCFRKNPVLLRALLFVFVVSSIPTSGSSFTYFQTDILHFSASFLSWTTVFQTAANFIAAYAYAKFLRTRNMRQVFCCAILLTMLTGLVNLLVVKRWNLALGIPDKLFVVGDTVAQGVAGEIIFMPIGVMAAHLAPNGMEGTVYAVTMSVLNMSWAFSEFLSGSLARAFHIASPDRYEHLGSLILVVSALTLVPLIFLGCIPELGQLYVEPSTEMEESTSEAMPSLTEGIQQSKGNERSEGI